MREFVWNEHWMRCPFQSEMFSFDSIVSLFLGTSNLKQSFFSIIYIIYQLKDCEDGDSALLVGEYCSPSYSVPSLLMGENIVPPAILFPLC
jgi:hypothetical protein